MNFRDASSEDVLGLAKEKDGFCIVNEADQRVKEEKEKGLFYPFNFG